MSKCICRRCPLNSLPSVSVCNWHLKNPNYIMPPDDLPPLWLLKYKKWKKVVGLNSQMPGYVHEYPDKCKWEKIQ